MTRILAIAAVLTALLAPRPAAAQQVDVQEFKLANGMRFLLVPRTDQPNVIAAGWLAKVGSVNERPGITGISHFFEHMMFKGTNTIGTRDAAKDADYRAKQKALRDRINAMVWNDQYVRFFRGEIDDPWNPANDTPELKDLRAQLKSLMDSQQGRGMGDELAKLKKELAAVDSKAADAAAKTDALKKRIAEVELAQSAAGSIVKDEFDQVYSKNGGSGMNAFTSHDLTFYFINVPSNKFELWAWMESDRLKDSVFREFYSERDVVHEERRLRTESTPTGKFQEQFDAMFWVSSGYGWPVIGWTSDLNSYTMEEAMKYWNIYYRANNLVGIIVGDFKPDEVKATVERYFGRLEAGKEMPPQVVTLEQKQSAEMRMNAEGDFQPQVEVRYHTVPAGHKDSYALEMMAAAVGRVMRRNEKGNETNEVERYDLRQEVSVRSGKVEAVESIAREVTDLIRDGVSVSSEQPVYTVGSIEEHKMRLLDEATRNAMERARTLAGSSGSTVGALRNASQGVVQVLARGAVDGGEWGQYDTSTIDKTMRVVVSLEYQVQ